MPDYFERKRVPSVPHFAMVSQRNNMHGYLLAAFYASLAFAHLVAAADEAPKTVVKVDVYYESLCSDSMRWIKDQLLPNYSRLKEHLNVTFIPYGKATHTRESKTGPWQFSCQHGSEECLGNKVQSCAIYVLASTIDAPDNRQDRTVDLIGCVMSSKYPPSAVAQCAQQVGLDQETQNGIRSCSEASLSSDLLAMNGDKTWALEPQLSFVPTIVINEVYSKENQNTALMNFSSVICGLLRKEEKLLASCN